MADDPKPTPEKPEPTPAPTGLTEEQVEQRVQAALQAERDKAAKDKQREKEEAERAEAEKRGEFEKVAQKEAEKREQAEAKAADAERRAQLAEVKSQLQDHLAAKHPDYITNATDIMLHVKESLPADAKPDAVAKLIEEQAKAFVERTPRAKVTGGTPVPPGRSAAIPANLPKPNPEARTTRRWAQQSYRG